MSQHVINWQAEDEPKKLLVFMFGWDHRLSQLFTQYHIEEVIVDSEGTQHFEAVDGSLFENNLTIKPSFIASNKRSVTEIIRNNIQTLFVESGIALSLDAINTIDIICKRMIEDATTPKYRLRKENYVI
ncbi:hypothetical protein [Vibrio sp. 10N.239.312.D08]|uniref:hypothetical protein n=1 Tax=Vibrio sp. 10N.239.312.D08 TaxID=3229978 RepID=UPI0035521CAB